MSERNEIKGCVSAISFNFVYYIVRQASNERTARKAIKSIRDIFEIIKVDVRIINQAIDSDFKDFEDAIQYACALSANSHVILTRNTADYKRSAIPVMSPDAYLSLPDGD